ncbi:MAG: phosphopentomutase [Bacillota bacterium]
MERALLIVLDSMGIGALPDAAEYGDQGSDTLGNICRAVPDLALPNLAALGLARITDLPLGEEAQLLPAKRQPGGGFGRMATVSPAKDTLTGHWELMGLITERPFQTFPEAFPEALIALLEQAWGTVSLGNEVAPGTEIIQRLGAEHIGTGYPIIYTSADSVLQIAAHEEIIPVAKLYEMCGSARRILDEHGFFVGRVIARPFIGEPGRFVRTVRRRDFSVLPHGETLLDVLAKAGRHVHAIGKIKDIFGGRGISSSRPTQGNQDGMVALREALDKIPAGLIFANLIDFDMLYGHRNDPQGYARALQEFDGFLPELLQTLTPRELLMIVADHGCDPTTESTDHSREYVPLLAAWGRAGSGCGGGLVDLGTRESLADVAATLGELFGLPVGHLAGRSCAAELRGERFAGGE